MEKMINQYDKLRKKVTLLLSRAGVVRVKSGQSEPDRTKAREAVRKAFLHALGNERARDLAIHLMDWTQDAAFVLALAMFPEKFSKKEVEAGVGVLLAHVPNHIFAAAKITGDQCEDIWMEKPASKMKTKKRPATPKTFRLVSRRK